MCADAEALVRCAELAGRHALALFFVALAGVLAAAFACAWGWQRRLGGQRRGMLDEQRAPRSLRFIAVRIGVGFACIVGAAWVFAELAEALGAGAAMGRADQALADALRARVPPAAVAVFAALTHLGDTATLTGLCVVVAIALVLRDRNGLAFGWVAAVAGNALLNTTLKGIFARVRPLHDNGLAGIDGFSFPSGHSSGSLVAYGMLAYLALRLLPVRWHVPAVLGAAALAFTVGASRIFLRVHFASDVIAGFASGAAWLAVCIASLELARWYLRRSADSGRARG